MYREAKNQSHKSQNDCAADENTSADCEKDIGVGRLEAGYGMTKEEAEECVHCLG